MVFWAHMEILKKYWGWGIAALVLIVGGYMLAHKAPDNVLSPGENSASSTPTGLATSTDTTSGNRPGSGSTAAAQFQVDKADAIASWTFKGTGMGNITLETQANADIDTLTKLLGKGTYDDYDLYNGIANDYTTLGNGAMAYHYYNLAVAIHPARGLVYMNLGHLFSLLGAEHTAVNAYAKAVAVEPKQIAYWLAYLDFLESSQPKSALTASVFASAITATNANPDVLISEANWLESIGRINDAIAAWQKVRPNVGADQQAAIDAKIQKLQAKLY